MKPKCKVEDCPNEGLYYDTVYTDKGEFVVTYCQEHLRDRAPEYTHECPNCGVQLCVN